MAMPGRPPSPDGRGERNRMLRVEYQGQPYDWFNLDDMGSLIESEDFANTLKENINHYFKVDFDEQAVFDEDGLLVAPSDFLRSLRHPRPYFRVFNLRQMPPELKEQTVERLSLLAQEVQKLQEVLRPGASPGTLSAPLVVDAAAIRSQAPAVEAATMRSRGLGPPETWNEVKAACPKCGQQYERENSLFCAACGSLRTEEVPQLSRAEQLSREMQAEPVVTNNSLADRLAGVRAANPCTVPNMSSFPSTLPASMGPSGMALPAMNAATEKPPGSRYGSCMVQGYDAHPSPWSGPSTLPNTANAEYFGDRAMVLTTDPAPIRSISFANGKDNYSFSTPFIEVTLRKEASGPATTCSCGNLFMQDAEFCRKCGQKRDMGSAPDRFGFANVPASDDRSLQITWIDPTGLLARWNSMHPESQAKEGHIIVSVNGVSEDVEAMRMQLQMQSIQMSIKEATAEPPADFVAPQTLPASSLPPKTGGCDATKLVLPQDVKLPQCSNCGNLYMTDSNFCRRCGQARARMSMR